MIIFPRPRIIFIISLAPVIPTYGLSIVVFYFVFKRPYDSRATSLILARAKRCLETGQREDLLKVNRGAISRVFSKFSVPEHELRYPCNVPFVRWGVLRHPMINSGEIFTLRIVRDGGNISIQSGVGEAWWLLQDPREDILFPNSTRTHDQGPESLDRFWALIRTAAKIGRPIERQNLKSDTVSELAHMNDNFVEEYFGGYKGMRFWREVDSVQYYIIVRSIDPSQEGESGVSIEASVVTSG